MFSEVGGYIPNPAGGVRLDCGHDSTDERLADGLFLKSGFIIIERWGQLEKITWAALFSYGEKDYYLGGSPFWQLFRVAYRITKSPTRWAGLACSRVICWAAFRRVKRPVSPELMRFHRREQMKKLRAIFWTLLRFEKVNSFRLAPGKGHMRGLCSIREVISTSTEKLMETNAYLDQYTSEDEISKVHQGHGGLRN